MRDAHVEPHVPVSVDHAYTTSLACSREHAREIAVKLVQCDLSRCGGAFRSCLGHGHAQSSLLTIAREGGRDLAPWSPIRNGIVPSVHGTQLSGYAGNPLSF